MLQLWRVRQQNLYYSNVNGFLAGNQFLFSKFVCLQALWNWALIPHNLLTVSELSFMGWSITLYTAPVRMSMFCNGLALGSSASPSTKMSYLKHKECKTINGLHRTSWPPSLMKRAKATICCEWVVHSTYTPALYLCLISTNVASSFLVHVLSWLKMVALPDTTERTLSLCDKCVLGSFYVHW